jgi:hypothetical protein
MTSEMPGRRITTLNPNLDSVSILDRKKEGTASSDLIAVPPFSDPCLTGRIEDCPEIGIRWNFAGLQRGPQHVRSHQPSRMWKGGEGVRNASAAIHAHDPSAVSPALSKAAPPALYTRIGPGPISLGAAGWLPVLAERLPAPGRPSNLLVLLPASTLESLLQPPVWRASQGICASLSLPPPRSTTHEGQPSDSARIEASLVEAMSIGQQGRVLSCAAGTVQ